MIQDYTLRVLEKTIQNTLAMDPELPSKLVPLHHKVIKMVINPLHLHFYIVFRETTLELHKDYPSPADTIIHSTPLGLIRLSLLPASQVRSLFNNQITISGDVLLGQEVKKLFDTLDIDWEGHLAQFTGDVVAYQIGAVARFGLGIKNRLHASLTSQVSEYIQEEARLSPSREELEDFMNDVDELTLRVARLEAHLNHNAVKHEKNNTDLPTTEN